jgi:hypothetical protein
MNSSKGVDIGEQMKTIKQAIEERYPSKLVVCSEMNEGQEMVERMIEKIESEQRTGQASKMLIKVILPRIEM